RPPPDSRQSRDRTLREPKTDQQIAPPTGPAAVESGVTVRDFSQALGVSMQDIIKILMSLGQMRTATQSLTDDEVELIAGELKREVTIKHRGEEDQEPETIEHAKEKRRARPPGV